MNCTSDAMYYRTNKGKVRVGGDCQLVDVETHTTIVGSDGAHPWIRKHATGKEQQRLLRATRPPKDSYVSPLDGIAYRKRNRR